MHTWFGLGCPYKEGVTCQERDQCLECGIYLAKFYPERLETRYSERIRREKIMQIEVTEKATGEKKNLGSIVNFSVSMLTLTATLETADYTILMIPDPVIPIHGPTYFSDLFKIVTDGLQPPKVP